MQHMAGQSGGQGRTARGSGVWGFGAWTAASASVKKGACITLPPPPPPSLPTHSTGSQPLGLPPPPLNPHPRGLRPGHAAASVLTPPMLGNNTLRSALASSFCLLLAAGPDAVDSCYTPHANSALRSAFHPPLATAALQAVMAAAAEAATPTCPCLRSFFTAAATPVASNASASTTSRASACSCTSAAVAAANAPSGCCCWCCSPVLLLLLHRAAAATAPATPCFKAAASAAPRSSCRSGSSNQPAAARVLDSSVSMRALCASASAPATPAACASYAAASCSAAAWLQSCKLALLLMTAASLARRLDLSCGVRDACTVHGQQQSHPTSSMWCCCARLCSCLSWPP